MFRARHTLALLAAGSLVVSAAPPGHASWPPAPGADLKDSANWPNDPDYAGYWNYWSFLPNRAANAPPLQGLDQKLGASGMHIDEAWAKTTGDDHVIVAVFDSGVYWENKDLVARYALNAAELAGTKAPRKADGSVCGDTEDLDGFDCDGNGVFDIQDYANDPRMTGTVAGEKCFTDGARTVLGPDRQKGDLNRNCILDPGDLILAFSDGVDDDLDGYKDNISGWDFLHNDNDAYDDTRYGHGNGEAEGVAAEGNNQFGGIGVCPKCRILPIRTGESYVGDSTDFAKGAVFAADSGATIFNIALGSINQTAASRAAIDYAYNQNILVVTSMADENARHHNMPATANHTLTVHSIRYDADSFDQSSTFVHFDRCSNFGGQMSLSISATSCSSEATEKTSGMAGLLYSYARKKNLQLSPNEAMQIFRQTADDIDDPLSRTVDGAKNYYYSQPGFDQRFGYGRPNARRMLETLDSGMIPPEVDVTTPAWFDPIYADRTDAVTISGTLRARRAQSWDAVVEWAPGVEPADAAFKVLTAYKNVPPTSSLGGTSGVPLATFDPKLLDSTHPQDADSPLGENDRTITLRVRATAHYPTGDVVGDARRTVAIVNGKGAAPRDNDLLPGFPLAVGSSIEGSPKIVDLDGDGSKEIIVVATDGLVHAYETKSGAPVEKAGFPYRLNLADGLDPNGPVSVPRYLTGRAYVTGGVAKEAFRETAINAPALGDLDGDGKKEIVITAWNGTIYVVNSAGNALPGFPKRLPDVPSCPLDRPAAKDALCMDVSRNLLRGTNASPVLVDLDKDGALDIVFGAFDGQMHALRRTGDELPGFPVSVQSSEAAGQARIMTTAAVGDLNGDGIVDLVTGSNQVFGSSGGQGEVTAIDGRGTKAPGGPILPHWPVRMAAVKLFPVVGEGIAAAPALGDLDGDGTLEVVMQGNGNGPVIVHADPGTVVNNKRTGAYLPGQFLSIFGSLTKANEDTFLPLLSQPSLGDLDQDGHPDVIASGASLQLALALRASGGVQGGQFLLAAWNGKTGFMVPGSPTVLGDYTFFVNHAVGDISGDGYPEIVTGTGGYLVHAVDGCGRSPAGWPKFTGGWVTGTAALGDANGDGVRDVVVGTREGLLFAWKTGAKAGAPLEWDSFHHDERNTGNMATPVGEAITARPAAALVCPSDDPVLPPAEVIDGGCSCEVGTTSTATPAWGAVFGVFAAAALRRRSQKQTANRR